MMGVALPCENAPVVEKKADLHRMADVNEVFASDQWQ